VCYSLTFQFIPHYRSIVCYNFLAVWEKVQKILVEKCYVPSHSAIVVAVSGGPDSICLLDLLTKLPYKINVAHLNHRLRKVSDEEQRFVVQRAKAYGLEIFSTSLNVLKMAKEEGLGIEEAARKARYQFLFRVAESTQSAAVLTAHHADDQVETILMNFIRGSGLKGLTGMQYRAMTPFHKTIPIVRPLLDIWKEVLIAYCRENGLNYYQDESNLGIDYFRNKVRNQLMPLLESYNPNFKQTLLRNQKAFQSDLDYIEEETEKALINLNPVIGKNQISFVLEKFMLLSDALQNYVLRKLIKILNPQIREISQNLIDKARLYLKEPQNKRSVLLKKDVYLLIEGGKGILATHPNVVWSNEWPFFDVEKHIIVKNGFLQLSDQWQLEVEVSTLEIVGESYQNNPNPFCAYLDVSHSEDQIKIRRWKPGDAYQPLGMGGRSMKLSDFWINQKIPPRAKEKWPLVEIENQIAWIPGFQPSHHFRIREETKRILILKFHRSG